jgi:hypothetical protein
MHLRIYRPSRNVMQSGRKGTERWIVEFEPQAPRELDPLMGWTSSPDTRAQLRLDFASKEEAVAYAESEGLPYTLEMPKERRIRPKAYVDNFRYDRLGRWTH